MSQQVLSVSQAVYVAGGFHGARENQRWGATAEYGIQP